MVCQIGAACISWASCAGTLGCGWSGAIQNHAERVVVAAVVGVQDRALGYPDAALVRHLLRHANPHLARTESAPYELR